MEGGWRGRAPYLICRLVRQLVQRVHGPPGNKRLAGVLFHAKQYGVHTPHDVEPVGVGHASEQLQGGVDQVRVSDVALGGPLHAGQGGEYRGADPFIHCQIAHDDDARASDCAHTWGQGWEGWVWEECWCGWSQVVPASQWAHRCRPAPGFTTSTSIVDFQDGF